ncbi:pyocin knob domain-containing protein [uncultured Bilophila sp.]|uniref:pyocin knob domain-containing protein n=5 Tax=uncultured Bilophila sp. TaxID=529385 RepID=UPI002608E0DD|nr:pyocin knob domain-containing protein [uncultured Bilophila sp.]
MAVKQLPKLSELPEPPDRLVGDQERFDVLTFNSLKAQKKMVNDDLNKTFIPKLNEFAVDVNASVDAAAQSERNAAAAATTAGNKANEAASSATTAGTKAGEASKSAAAAKTSETNAAASKTAAAKSATDAQAAQRGAEAARDEAQDLANVGYASDAKAGLAKVDGKTMQADAGGMITAKDVAIGGDKTDLASDRGQIGNIPTTRIADFNTFLESGVYRATWGGDNPGLNTPPGTVNGMVYVASWKNAVGEIMECRQIVYRLGTPGSNDWNIFTREMMSGGTWSPWRWMLTDISLGDGLRFTSGKFSVPEYDGATSSADGVSGLVPAATSAQADHALTGDGTWKSFLSTNGGTVSGAVTATGGFKGKADTATKLATARTIDGVSFNGSANITHYGSCATEAATAAKVVACTGFALATGSRITVRFTVTNTAASPTLNVNGTGAKALRYRNAAIAAGYLAANRTYDFVYDGTYYQLVGDINTDSTAIPKGTRMLFYQASAPSGWTQLKDTELTDATIRLVTGGAGVTEGSRAFQDVFKDGLASTNAAAGGTVGNTTLTESQMPSHRHSITTCADNGTSNSYPMGPGDTQRTQTNWTANTGGSGAHAHSFTGTSHNHSLNLNVKRATCMVCSKN